MNVFRVDDCPLEAARALCDAHLASQVKEAAQLLSTAARMRAAALGAPPPDLYRATHAGHPCTLAAASSQDFAVWTLRHALELDAERLRRYPGREENAALRVARRAWEALLALPPVGPSRPWPQAMPSPIPRRPVEAYRAYYASAKTVGPAGWSRRAPLGRWTGRRPPRWLEERGCAVVPHGDGAWLAVREDSH